MISNHFMRSIMIHSKSCSYRGCVRIATAVLYSGLGCPHVQDTESKSVNVQRPLGRAMSTMGAQLPKPRKLVIGDLT